MLVWFVTALVWLQPEPASACSVGIPIFDAPEPTATSTGVPSLQIEGYDLERGCGSGGGSCGDIGFLSIALTASPPVAWETIGAYIRVQSGDAPIPYSYDRPFVVSDGILSIAFGDGEPPAIDFTITVQAIDRNGRLGQESEELHIEHGGGNAICCSCTSTSSARSESGIAWLPLAAFLLRRKAR
jgi:hypothetical protein